MIRIYDQLPNMGQQTKRLANAKRFKVGHAWMGPILALSREVAKTCYSNTSKSPNLVKLAFISPPDQHTWACNVARRIIK